MWKKCFLLFSLFIPSSSLSWNPTTFFINNNYSSCNQSNRLNIHKPFLGFSDDFFSRKNLFNLTSSEVLLDKMNQFLPPSLAEYTPALKDIAKILYNVLKPIARTTISPFVLKQLLFEYTFLQQSFRKPTNPLKLTRSLEKELREWGPLHSDLNRWMGYSAAAYGNLGYQILYMMYHLKFKRIRGDVLPLLVPGVSSKDVIRRDDAIFSVNLSAKGYILVVDHSRRCLVLAIRGTFHVKDIITDLHCDSSPLDFDFPGFKMGSAEAHEGFLQASQYLDRTLRPLVRRVLDDLGGNYSLVLCGHSLGAGVASLLALRWYSVFPDVRCVAMCAPPILSLAAARACTGVVTSVVVGDDFVSRLSKGSVSDLRDALLFLNNQSSRIRENLKTKILKKILKHCTILNCVFNKVFRKDIKHQNHRQSVLFNTVRRKTMTHPKLFPAGRIIHIIERKEWNHEKRDSGIAVLSKTSDLIAYFADQEYFSEIQCSNSMLVTHWPDDVLKKLSQLNISM